MIHPYDLIYCVVDRTLGARPEFLFQLQCLLIAALGIGCRKIAAERLRRVPRALWLSIGAVVLAQAFALLVLRRPFAGLSEEWEELYLGKLLSEGRVLEFKLIFRHGPTWPLILSQALRLGAPGPEAPVWLSIGAALLTGVCLFASGSLLLGDPAAGLAAATLFAVSPSMMKNSAVFHGKPIAALALTGLCWTALGLCAGGRSWRARGLLALLLAALIQLRQELGLYVPVFALGTALLSGGKLQERARDWLIPAGLLALFGGFYYVCLANGLDAFVRAAGQGPTVLDSTADCAGALACAGKFAGVSLAFWLSRWELPVAALFLFGALPDARIPRRPALLLAGAFVLHNLAYVLHNSLPEERFLVQAYFPFLLLAGAGAVKLWRASQTRRVRAALAAAALLVLGARAAVWPAALRERDAAESERFPAARRVSLSLNAGPAGLPPRVVDTRDAAFLHLVAADGLALSYQDLDPSLATLGRGGFAWITEARVVKFSPRENAVADALTARCAVGEAFSDGPWTVRRVTSCAGSRRDVDTAAIWDAKTISDEGVSMHFEGDLTGAGERFDAALARDPRSCAALQSRAALRDRLGDGPGADADRGAAAGACGNP
jgi:hypothetical protein